MEKRSKERALELEIYTDGSLKKIDDKTFGGWAFIAVKDSQVQEIEADHACDTTNQRMELTAIVYALQYASHHRKENERVVIYSDSAYIVNCYLEEWYIKWLDNNWMTSKNQPVANQDLWEKIIPYFDNFWYTFKKVDGHNGVYWNEQADEAAQAQADLIKKEFRG